MLTKTQKALLVKPGACSRGDLKRIFVSLNRSYEAIKKNMLRGKKPE